MAIWYPSNRKINKTHTLTERRLQVCSLANFVYYTTKVKAAYVPRANKNREQPFHFLNLRCVV